MHSAGVSQTAEIPKSSDNDVSKATDSRQNVKVGCWRGLQGISTKLPSRWRGRRAVESLLGQQGSFMLIPKDAATKGLHFVASELPLTILGGGWRLLSRTRSLVLE